MIPLERKLRHYEETNEIDNNVLKTRIYISLSMMCSTHKLAPKVEAFRLREISGLLWQNPLLYNNKKKKFPCLEKAKVNPAAAAVAAPRYGNGKSISSKSFGLNWS
jgi:hypothetical protein